MTRASRTGSRFGSQKVGLLQVLALIPGFSRTGSTLAGGLMVGLSHEDSLRYSFLLATPIIGAAALLEIPAVAYLGRERAHPGLARGRHRRRVRRMVRRQIPHALFQDKDPYAVRNLLYRNRDCELLILRQSICYS